MNFDSFFSSFLFVFISLVGRGAGDAVGYGYAVFESMTKNQNPDFLLLLYFFFGGGIGGGRAR